MRTRIVGATVLASFLALALFGIPLAIGLGRMAFSDERAGLQRVADLVARSSANDLAHDRVPDSLSPAPDGMQIGLYDEDGQLLTGQGPAQGDIAVQRALRRGVAQYSGPDLVATASVNDTHDAIGAVRVAVPAVSIYLGLVPIWLGMAALALVVLLAIWAAARRMARRLAGPVEQLAVEAARLGEGDFGVRPQPTGLPEVDRVGQALTHTAERLDDLLARERAFSAEASHQLRTPLAGLRLRLESSLDQPEREARTSVADGIAAVDRLEQTIEELLRLSREPRSAVTAALNLSALLRGLDQEWTDRFATEQRSLSLCVPTDLPDVIASAAAVRQVLAVLLDNALVHGRGTVRVTARNVEEHAVAVDVADEGGVRIADPDLSGEASVTAGMSVGDRRGMGLPLARRLAEAEGGRLLVASAASTATLLLQVASPALPVAPTDPSADELNERTSYRTVTS